MKRFAYVGCRTTRERNARGNGIELYKVNDRTGEWSHLGTVGGLENPSYLAFDKDHKYLYSAHGDTTEASAFRLNPENGMPVYLNTVQLGGSNPVYLVPDPSNQYILIACLGSGSIVAVRREVDGSLGSVDYQYVFPGNEEPQKMTCPHQVYYDLSEKYLVVSLKGTKKTTIPAKEGLAVFKFTPEGGFEEIYSISGRNFDHCRHVAIHPNNKVVYQINELHSCVISLYLDNATGHMTPFQISQTLPDNCVETKSLLAGGICITKDGRYLYASNRGHDSIAMFRIDQETFRLTNIGWVPSMGSYPRFICLDPGSRFLYVANEQSDLIAEFEVTRSGILKYRNYTVKTGSPVCILFSG